MIEYLKRAFFSRWNVLFFTGTTAAALLSPWPDMLVPLVAAGELLYLGGLVSVPRFRQAVDAEVAARSRAAGTGRGQPVPALTQLVAWLSPEAQERFAALRRRCLSMRSIARSAQPPGTSPDVTDVWTPSLDRLLYGFLRLLAQQNSLLRFLKTTTDGDLTKSLEALKQKLAAAQGSGDERMIHSLQESVTIAEQRLDNYRKAAKNAEFADLELDRVEAKIQALIELAANRQDPNLLSGQVDAAADSMHRTETTLNELQQLTGVAEDLDQVPAILDQPLKPVVSDDARAR